MSSANACAFGRSFQDWGDSTVAVMTEVMHDLERGLSAECAVCGRTIGGTNDLHPESYNSFLIVCSECANAPACD